MAKLAKLLAAAALMVGMSSAWAQGKVHEAVVLDTMDSGGYTYVQVKEGDTVFWAAGPQVTLAKGDKVQLAEQMWMSKFTSKTLNRTFDKIMFVGEIAKK
ncbi:NrfJ [Shewanella avicenniae]|uniref:NrfJ n=1 Tax=Shewanella avicenniae TaxID=2814294 RepID=A0ABX7QU73_9GAMM|nr:NrfJ [Shewanella avicenniae]QSX34819.1 NrfJ [Shewanella avicenniae]